MLDSEENRDHEYRLRKIRCSLDTNSNDLRREWNGES